MLCTLLFLLLLLLLLLFLFCRTILQFSALCQCVYRSSSVINALLKLLDDCLSPLTSSPSITTSVDVNLLQWLSLLITHILSSISLKQDEGSHDDFLSLFAPILTLPSVDPTNELLGDLDNKIDKLNRLSKKINKYTEAKATCAKLSQKLGFPKDWTTKEILSEIKKKTQKLQEAKSMVRAIDDGDRPPAKHLTYKKSSKNRTRGNSLGLSLSPQLVGRVTKGLAQLVVVLTRDGEWSIVPVISRVSVITKDQSGIK